MEKDGKEKNIVNIISENQKLNIWMGKYGMEKEKKLKMILIIQD